MAKSKRTPELEKSVYDLLKAGNTKKVAALASGISQDTFYEYMKDADFSDMVTRAESECQARYVTLITKAAAEDWKAAAWYLNNRVRDEFHTKQAQDHTTNGKDMPSVVVYLPSNGRDDAE